MPRHESVVRRTALLERRQRVSQLYLDGKTMAEISQEVGIALGTVYGDIKWAREQWRTRAADAIEQLKQCELALID